MSIKCAQCRTGTARFRVQHTQQPVCSEQCTAALLGVPLEQVIGAPFDEAELAELKRHVDDMREELRILAASRPAKERQADRLQQAYKDSIMEYLKLSAERANVDPMWFGSKDLADYRTKRRDLIVERSKLPFLEQDKAEMVANLARVRATLQSSTSSPTEIRMAQQEKPTELEYEIRKKDQEIEYTKIKIAVLEHAYVEKHWWVTDAAWTRAMASLDAEIAFMTKLEPHLEKEIRALRSRDAANRDLGQLIERQAVLRSELATAEPKLRRLMHAAALAL